MSRASTFIDAMTVKRERNEMKQIKDKFDIIIPPQDIGCEPGLQQRLANGDGEVFAWVYKNYCRKVFDYALMITRSKSVSEDVVQDVFLKLWQHPEKLQDVKDFNSYLYTLYRNHVWNVLERQQVERRKLTHYHHAQTQITNYADEPLLYAESRQRLQIAISKLPPQQRAVFILRKAYALNQEQAAQRMGIALNTGRRHMVVALGRIRQSLLEYK